jgi:hypothetical protein
MPFLTLWKICFGIEHNFCMVEYVKNINIRYIKAMTFQIYTKFFMKEHI